MNCKVVEIDNVMINKNYEQFTGQQVDRFQSEINLKSDQDNRITNEFLIDI